MAAFGATRRVLGGLSMVLAATAAPPPAAAAADLQLLRSGTAHDMLFDVAFEGPLGIAAGNYGSVLLSEDGGAKWRPVGAADGKQALLGSAIHDGRCLVVGQMGTVLMADDCRSWRAVDSGSQSRLMGVALHARGLAYAVGEFGTVLRSEDGGLTWQTVELDWSELSPTGEDPHLYDVAVTADGGVTLVGEFGVILRSRDGAAWRRVHSGEQSLFGLSITGQTGYAVGQSGAVLASSDGGDNWRPLDTGSSAILTGIWSDGKGRVVASGINTVLQSDDGGRHWRQVDAGVHEHAMHVAVAASKSLDGGQRVLLVGSAAAVLELLR